MHGPAPGLVAAGAAAAPEDGQDTPETWEHSVEVQVPFLQKLLKNFKLLPVVMGEADPAQVAGAGRGSMTRRLLSPVPT